jgi:hypothetical protein
MLPFRRHAAADDIDTLSPLSFSFSFDTISMLFDADRDAAAADISIFSPLIFRR